MAMKAEACNFIKKRLWHGCFPVNFVEFLGTPFLTEQLRWLLLNDKQLPFQELLDKEKFVSIHKYYELKCSK